MGFIVTNLPAKAKGVVHFYNGRGTVEQPGELSTPAGIAQSNQGLIITQRLLGYLTGVLGYPDYNNGVLEVIRGVLIRLTIRWEGYIIGFKNKNVRGQPTAS